MSNVALMCMHVPGLVSMSLFFADISAIHACSVGTWQYIFHLPDDLLATTGFLFNRENIQLGDPPRAIILAMATRSRANLFREKYVE